MKTNRILAVFLTVSAVALGLPAHAANALDNPDAFKSEAGAETPRERPDVREEVREGATAIGDFADDALITTKVKAALLADDDIKSLDISVKTIDNIVYLSGKAGTATQRDRAERLARDIKGVKSVVNHLHIDS